MKIVAISDVHVKKPFDEADSLLSSFLNHQEVQSSDIILLLGDIFDLMCGPHNEYLNLYRHQFQSLTDLHKSGKRIYFFEGNHDIHLKKLFKKIWKNDEVILSQNPIVIEVDGKSYYFSHGDEHEVDNTSYQRYIKIIRSFPLRFAANYLIPFGLLNFFGEKASKMSRKKGSKKFDAEKVRSRFRVGVTISTKGKYSFVLGGHSHVQDKFSIPNSNSLYINNGYAIKTKTFIKLENHEISFVPLT